MSGLLCLCLAPELLLKELILEIPGTSRSSAFRMYVIRRPQFTISTTSPSVMRRSYSHLFALPGVTAVFTRPTSSLLDFLRSASRSRDLANEIISLHEALCTACDEAKWKNFTKKTTSGKIAILPS